MAQAPSLEQVVSDEELFERLTPHLSSIERLIVSGAGPDAQERQVLDAAVVTRDLEAWSGKAGKTQQLRRGLWLGEWSVEEEAREVSQPEVSLLTPVMEALAQVDRLELAFQKGRRVDASGTRLEAEVVVSVAGELRDGGFVSVSIQALTEWHGGSTGSSAEWRLRRWEVQRAETTVAETVLFVETLDQRLLDPDSLASARFSRHEGKVVEVLSDPSRHPGLELESFDRHPGVAVADVNGDGRDDVLATQRWGPPTLLVQQPDGSFVDEAVARGLVMTDHCSAPLFFDMDNDGDADLFMGRTLAASILLENHDGRFVDVSHQLEDGGPYLVSHVAAGDLNQDGLVDLHVSQYAASRIEQTWEWHQRESRTGPYLSGLIPEADAVALGQLVDEGAYEHYLSRPGPRNVVLQNHGAGRFGAVETEGVDALRPFLNTYATALSDLDGDGDLDAYLANDFAPNVVARNDGNWSFVDVTLASGAADFGFGMGAGVGDVDGDGQMDLLVSNMYSKAGRRITGQLTGLDPRIGKAANGNSLFRNAGGLRFERWSGGGPQQQPIEAAGWAWAADVEDFDLDGRNDVFSLSGYYSAPWQFAREHDC